MTEFMFLLCAVISAMATYALFKGYWRTGNRLLLWSGFCFAILFLSNLFLCIDLIMFPQADLHGPFWRNLLSAVAGTVLLCGLVLELS
jgi:hypothetical protein